MSEDSLDRPLLVFDGECPFCRAWVTYWKHLTGDRVLYASYQEVGQRFPKSPAKSSPLPSNSSCRTAKCEAALTPCSARLAPCLEEEVGCCGVTNISPVSRPFPKQLTACSPVTDPSSTV